MPELTTVWEGNDSDFLNMAIPFYLRRPAESRLLVLDTTFGRGNFWRGMNQPGWRVVGMDINREKQAELLADYQYLPVKDESVDVVIYDPPHVPHGDSLWDLDDIYGIDYNEDDITRMFEPFLNEAERVLKPEGIIIAKMADHIRRGTFHPQMAALVMLITEYPSLRMCNIVVKTRTAARPQPSRVRQLHARQRHSYFIIARKSKRC